MNELKVVQTLGSISFNFDELKAEVQNMANTYASLVYTDEVIGEAKEDRAKLNKLKTALNDERKRREKEFNEPFQQFKSEVNTLISIIDEPINAIDEQIKGYEAEKKNRKRVEIETYFSGVEKPDWLNLAAIWNEKWLNATTSMKQIQAEIGMRLATIEREMQTLEKMPAFAFEAMEEYKRNLDISQAIAEGQRLADIQRRKEEAEKKAKAEEAATMAAVAQPTTPPVANTDSEIPFNEEPQEDYIPSFEETVKMLVKVPQNKVMVIGKWLEDNGCEIEII